MILKICTSIAVLVFLCAKATLLGGCASSTVGGSKSQHQVQEKPEDLIAKIKVGMTFSEIARIIPLSTNDTGMQTAGSIWFHVPLDGRHTVALRFSRPAERDGDLNSIILTLPPRLILRGESQDR